MAQRLDVQERALLDQVMRRGDRGVEESDESQGLIRSMRNNIAQRRQHMNRLAEIELEQARERANDAIGGGERRNEESNAER